MTEDLGPTHAVVIYDPVSGVIRHTLLQMTLKDAPAADWAAMEAKLMALVKEHDPASASLPTLRSENHNTNDMHMVDPQRRTLVKVGRGTRPDKV
jgi:hypothetical protein